MDQTIDLTERRYFRSDDREFNRIFNALSTNDISFRSTTSEWELLMSDSVYDELYGRDFIINNNKKLEIVSELALEEGNNIFCPCCGRVSIKPQFYDLCPDCEKMQGDTIPSLLKTNPIRNSRYFNL